MKIYVASSWRNQHYPTVVKCLKDLGHEVYDFRTDGAFRFSEVDPDWKDWNTVTYKDMVWNHPHCTKAFKLDFGAMQWADAMLMVGPCGRSAHLEMGWACGQGLHTAVLLLEPQEPELMYRMIGKVLDGLGELLDWGMELHEK